MFQPSSSGRLDIALSRISGLPKSGKGKIGTVQTIGVEEIEGFRPDDPIQDIEPVIDIEVENVIGMDSKGKSFTVPTIGTSVPLKRIDKASLLLNSNKEISTSIYPIPADDILHITALNKGSFSRVKIFNLVGSVVYDSQSVDTKSLDINIGNVTPGIYIVEMIQQEGGLTTKKIQISH
jgi:hypothetical protein